MGQTARFAVRLPGCLRGPVNINTLLPLLPQVDVAQVQNFRRCILDFRLEALPGCSWGGRELLQLHIRGTAFLWHQVGWGVAGDVGRIVCNVCMAAQCWGATCRCAALAWIARVDGCGHGCLGNEIKKAAVWPSPAGALHGGGSAHGGPRGGAAGNRADAAGHAAVPAQAAVRHGLGCGGGGVFGSVPGGSGGQQKQGKHVGADRLGGGAPCYAEACLQRPQAQHLSSL